MTTYVPKGVPRATYRVQFRQGFGFSDAIKIVPYWAKLGISHLYASPLTVARPGSPHGYDVVDPTRLNPELGSDEDFDRLAAALAANNMGLLLDIVPNHMSASVDNQWWRDVLINGRASHYADFFVVYWESEGGKIVLPILGQSLDQAIAEGGVSCDGVSLNAGGVRLPLAPGTSGGAVRRVLDQQYYRLSCWRDDTPNYRRFFEINDLIGMRVEDPAVFEATHALFLRLLAEGKVQGLRVDHIDGLRDPAAYLAKLRTRATEAAGFVPYIVVEKILGPGEELPVGWPVAGATGYDWLGMANGLLADGRGMRGLDRAYRAFTGGIFTLRRRRLPAQTRDAPVQVPTRGSQAGVGLYGCGWRPLFRRRRRGGDRRTLRVLACVPHVHIVSQDRTARCSVHLGRRSAGVGSRRSRRVHRSAGCVASASRLRPQVARTRHAVAAAYGSSDGQGTGGLGVLPLQPAHLAERSGWASRRRNAHGVPSLSPAPGS